MKAQRLQNFWFAVRKIRRCHLKTNVRCGMKVEIIFIKK
jgi:hypothetical protein